MSSDELSALLASQGNASEIAGSENGFDAIIKVRGVPFFIHCFKSPDDLIRISSIWIVPEAITKETLDAALSTIAESYPIIHTDVGISDERNTFEISIETFLPVCDSTPKIFWKLIDLIVAAGDECFKSLVPQALDANPTAVQDLHNEIEKQMRAGALAIGKSDGKETTVERVRNSLGLVVNSTGGTGTAFCFKSEPHFALFLTNKHVVGDDSEVALYRQCPSFGKSQATVLCRGQDELHDLAVLRIRSHVANPLVLRDDVPLESQGVCLAGYPTATFYAADTYGELCPSFHQGTISARLDRGAILLHDAISRPGNSGGPLFDPLTGGVFGIVQGGWEKDGENVAIGSAMTILPFLKAHPDRLTIKRAHA